VSPDGYRIAVLGATGAVGSTVLEILAHNPYHAQLKRSERVLARARRQITTQADAAAGKVEDSVAVAVEGEFAPKVGLICRLEALLHPL
jgi:aspartate-semialdehyde dehydrogenase